MARSTHFTTTATVAATLLPSASIFYGLAAAAAETIYIKLFWEGTGTRPPLPGQSAQPATTAPVAGTTIPHLTIGVPTGTSYFSMYPVPLNNGGRIWYWITGAAADTDTTALTGGDVVTLIYD